ncbi:diguanylate cyclase domain-containing protein [Crocosphaera sp. Alani8]|uniref:diguanylate cyclase domain-containing protein n=1 Tax=Crocosphaera sp. Alani8 TaxID=3038952 RepID=UPI00313D16C2
MIKNKVNSISNNPDITTFNYQRLNPQLRDRIQELTVDIKNRLRRCAQDIYIIGYNLCQIKQQLKHGEFRIWLKTEFDWSVSAANKFMHVSQRFCLDDLEEVEISPSALYVLAAPSTPQEVRNQALIKAKQGQTITFSFAKQLLKDNQNKPPELTNDDEINHNTATTANLSLFYQSDFLDFISVKKDKICPSGEIYDPFDFNDYLEQEWRRMLRAEQYLSLVICKIDTQNSSYEELLVYQLIQQVGYGLADSLKRTGDFIGQYDDDQCVAVLPNTHIQGVQCVIERFMKWFTAWKKNFNQFDEFNTIRICIGTASIIPKQELTPQSLIQKALLNRQIIE